MEQLLLELSPEIQKWLDAKSDDRNIRLSIALQDWIDFWVQNLKSPAMSDGGAFGRRSRLRARAARADARVTDLAPTLADPSLRTIAAVLNERGIPKLANWRSYRHRFFLRFHRLLYGSRLRYPSSFRS